MRAVFAQESWLSAELTGSNSLAGHLHVVTARDADGMAIAVMCGRVGLERAFAQGRLMMTKSIQAVRALARSFIRGTVLYPLWILTWPFVQLCKTFYTHFLAYLLGAVVRDKRRVYSVKFIWYGDSVYLHPMVWGSLLLSLLSLSERVPAGFVLLAWFVSLFVCFMTIMYNFNVIRSAVLVTGLIAFFGLAYFATVRILVESACRDCQPCRSARSRSQLRLLRRSGISFRRLDFV